MTKQSTQPPEVIQDWLNATLPPSPARFYHIEIPLISIDPSQAPTFTYIVATWPREIMANPLLPDHFEIDKPEPWYILKMGKGLQRLLRDVYATFEADYARIGQAFVKGRPEREAEFLPLADHIGSIRKARKDREKEFVNVTCLDMFEDGYWESDAWSEIKTMVTLMAWWGMKAERWAPRKKYMRDGDGNGVVVRMSVEMDE